MVHKCDFEVGLMDSTHKSWYFRPKIRPSLNGLCIYPLNIKLGEECEWIKESYKWKDWNINYHSCLSSNHFKQPQTKISSARIFGIISIYKCKWWQLQLTRTKTFNYKLVTLFIRGDYLILKKHLFQFQEQL